jgi:hypothetical protein
MKILHTVCGGVAFFYAGEPKVGKVITAEFARYPDGSQPTPGDILICGSCHQPIATVDGATTQLRRGD